MNNALDVLLVDSHREGNCTTEDSDLVAAELFLYITALVFSLACMVASSSDALLVQICSDLVSGSTRRRVEQD